MASGEVSRSSAPSAVGHAGIMEDDHRHRQRPLVEIGRRPVDEVHGAQWRTSRRPRVKPSSAAAAVGRRRAFRSGRRRRPGGRGRARCRSAPSLLVWPITVSPAPSISQPSVGHRRGQPLERQRLLLGAEVEQDVAAQDDVELARVRRRLEQIVDLEADRLAQRLDRAPAVGAFLEPLDHLVDAEAALDLELGVGAGAGAIDARGRHVGAEDVDRPAAPLLRRSRRTASPANRLPGRSSSRPTRCGAASCLARRLASSASAWRVEQVERRAVAEEIGFVVEQGLDHLVATGRAPCP